ncbi:hypothetical protein PMAYCL1PPCAC_25850, partial [Pristionchus mayeri]
LNRYAMAFLRSLYVDTSLCDRVSFSLFFTRVEIIPFVMSLLGEDKEMEILEVLKSHIRVEAQIDR